MAATAGEEEAAAAARRGVLVAQVRRLADEHARAAADLEPAAGSLADRLPASTETLPEEHS